MDAKMKKRMRKHGQVTIFIIIAIVIVVLVALFFILGSEIDLPIIGGQKETQPRLFLETCLEDKIREGIKLISEQGGNIEPELYKTFRFEGEEEYTNISYLCYTQNYYTPCVNQEPMLINHIEEELHDYIEEDVGNCFEDLKNSLRGQGYTITNPRYNGFDVELAERKIVVDIDAELTLTKNQETSRQKDFKVVVPSRIYEIAYVAQEIVGQEARFCNFEYLGYMLLYPEFYIDKFSTSDSIKIYTIIHEDAPDNKFKFAIRSCAIPSGFF